MARIRSWELAGEPDLREVLEMSVAGGKLAIQFVGDRADPDVVGRIRRAMSLEMIEEIEHDDQFHDPESMRWTSFSRRAADPRNANSSVRVKQWCKSRLAEDHGRGRGPMR